MDTQSLTRSILLVPGVYCRRSLFLSASGPSHHPDKPHELPIFLACLVLPTLHPAKTPHANPLRSILSDFPANSDRRLKTHASLLRSPVPGLQPLRPVWQRLLGAATAWGVGTCL